MNIRQKTYSHGKCMTPSNQQPRFLDHSRNQQLKKQAVEVKANASQPQEQHVDPKRDFIICCKACQQIITKDEFSIAVDGNNEHIQCNPYGFTFIFRCFNQVWHCMEVGDAQSAHSWFPGFDWTLILCESCTTHLGWVFNNHDGMRFWGLISDRLSTHSQSS